MPALQKDAPQFVVNRHTRCQQLLGNDDAVRLLVVDVKTHVNVPEIFVLFRQILHDRRLLCDIRGRQLYIGLSVCIKFAARQLPYSGAVRQFDLHFRSRRLFKGKKICQSSSGQCMGKRVCRKVAKHYASVGSPVGDPHRKKVHCLLDAVVIRMILPPPKHISKDRQKDERGQGFIQTQGPDRQRRENRPCSRQRNGGICTVNI